MTLKIRKVSTETANITSTIWTSRRTMKRAISATLQPTLARGSSASRTPSPNTFSERTVSTSIAPGTIARCGAVAIRSMPSSIIVPQEGLGGRTPAPRKESAASSRMALAIRSVKKTRIVDARFGTTSPNMIRSGPAPWARAASTNSFSRSESTCPRIGPRHIGHVDKSDDESWK